MAYGTRLVHDIGKGSKIFERLLELGMVESVESTVEGRRGDDWIGSGCHQIFRRHGAHGRWTVGPVVCTHETGIDCESRAELRLTEGRNALHVSQWITIVGGHGSRDVPERKVVKILDKQGQHRSKCRFYDWQLTKETSCFGRGVCASEIADGYDIITCP